MGYIYTNPNPKGAITGDCVVRAVAIANNLDWDTAYLILSDYGFRMKNMPNADSVWSKVLKDFGNLEEARVVTLSKKTCNNGLLGLFKQ